jgi:hypothetical protein
MISRYQLNREESIVRKKYDQPILQDAPNRTTEIRLRLVFLAHESLGNNCMCYINQTGVGEKKKARCEYNPGLFCSARQAGTTLCVISCHLIFTSLASLFCCSGRSPRQQFKRPVHEYIVYIVYPLRQNSTRTYVSYHPLTQDQSISSNIFHQWPTGTLVH